ncbi:hypothetical protein ALQ25_200246 [Pseudomonas coronafaciens pv. atropurpurea]|nr:hypothetical protein ALQ25_200246 [Pseudomonas coronafaciens pv. atropurpurea]
MLRRDHPTRVHVTVKQQVPGSGAARIGCFGRTTHRAAVAGVVLAVAPLGGNQRGIGFAVPVKRLQLTVNRVLAQVHFEDAACRASGHRGRRLRHHRVAAVHHVHSFIGQQIGTANTHRRGSPEHDQLGQ